MNKAYNLLYFFLVGAIVALCVTLSTQDGQIQKLESRITELEVRAERISDWSDGMTQGFNNRSYDLGIVEGQIELLGWNSWSPPGFDQIDELWWYIARHNERLQILEYDAHTLEESNNE